MAKKRKSKPESIAFDNTASGDERIAYELIKLFAGAMKSLNGGVLPIPLNWQEHLRKSLNPKPQVGKLPKAATKIKGIKLAKAVIAETIRASDEDKRPFLKGLGDSTNIHRDAKNHMGEAAAELLTENIIKRDQQEYEQRRQMMLPIKQRLDNGESAWDILLDPNATAAQYAAAKDFEEHGIPLEGFPPKDILTEREKAVAWTSDGMNRHIHAPDEHPVFIIRDEYDVKVVKAISKKKKNLGLL